MRNKITNLLAQSDGTKSARSFQEMHSKIELLQSNVVQLKTKCYSLMLFNSKLNVTLKCGSANNQMIHSNVGAPIVNDINLLYKLVDRKQSQPCDNSHSSSRLSIFCVPRPCGQKRR